MHPRVGAPMGYSLFLDVCLQEEERDKRNNPVRVTRAEDILTRRILDGLFPDNTCDWLRIFLGQVSEKQNIIKTEEGVGTSTWTEEECAAIKKENEELERVIQSGDCKAMFFAFTEEAKGVRRMTDVGANSRTNIFDQEVVAKHNEIKNKEAFKLWDNNKGRKVRTDETKTVENGGISEIPIEGMRNIFRNLFAKPNSVDTPGMLQLVADEESDQVDAFRTCNVPWIGGVSGSILERILFLHQIDPKLVSDESVLGMMAAFEVSGHHSLSEVAIVAKEAVDKLGSDNCGLIRQLVVPMELATMKCNGHEEFTQSMENVISSVVVREHMSKIYIENM